MKNSKTQRAINILSFISACLAIYFDYAADKILFSVFKPLTTILILSLLFFVQSGTLSKYRSLIIVALVFCLLGDIFLLKDSYFVFGLGSFLIGHLLFASAFIKLEGFHFHWVSLLIFLAIGGGILFWLRPDLGDFELPVTIYVIVIIFMAWQGLGLFLRQKQRAYLLIALAVLLFMFSDTMIAINKFKSPFNLSGLVILSTYWMSIALISNASYLILGKKS
ncbi:lysoplasmalogenase [Flagellimonas sp.]|uniref:lysoplasmalogenase n=1 Tax=Flagellimonas sp. TaxID=2058762 RepID=UPI003B5C8627